MEKENGTRRISPAAVARIKRGITGIGIDSNSANGNTSGSVASDSGSGNTGTVGGDILGGEGASTNPGTRGNGIGDTGESVTRRGVTESTNGTPDGTRRRIQFDFGGSASDTGDRKPRTVRIDATSDNETPQPNGASTVGRGRSKKQSVSNETANMLLQMVFFCVALALGEHWQKTEDDVTPAAVVLARMLSKLPIAATKALDTYIDPLIFVMAMAALCADPLKIEAAKKAHKHNAIPINQTKAAAADGYNQPPQSWPGQWSI